MRSSTSSRAATSVSSSVSGYRRCPRRTSPSCCDRACARTNGCWCCTVPFWVSAPGGYTWRSSVSDNGDRRERLDVSLLRATPTLARLAAGASVRTAQWGLATSVRVGTRLVRAAAAGESPAQLMQEASEDVRDYARHFLGMSNGSDPLAAEHAPPPPVDERLRERGAELLAQSVDVDYKEPAHPAFARILEELAPDEARILRMLYKAGPQPAVDVRESKPLGIAAGLVEGGLSMIGTE